MPHYRVAINWEVTGYVYLDADGPNEAQDEAQRMIDLDLVPTVRQVVDGVKVLDVEMMVAP